MPSEGRAVRLNVVAVVAVSLFAALFARLWYLQVADAETYEQVAAANQTRTVQIPAMRGRILDREGRVLADNRRSLSVVVDRQVIRRKAVREILFERLAGALGTTPEALEKRYTSDQYDPYLPLPLADDVDEGVAVFLKERAEDYPGVSVQESWQRVYRYAPYASHVLGYVGKLPADQRDQYLARGYRLSDVVGRNGVELVYEDELRGTPGYVVYEVDAKNRIVRVVDRKDPVPGNDIQLTIDLRLQQYAEMVLKRGLEEARGRSPRNNPDVRFPAPAGAVVVQEPATGAILAMATYPTYDNRWFVGGLRNDKYRQLFPDDRDRSPLVNRAVSGRYQLGSTMKLFTSVAALTSGQIPNPNWTVDDRGSYTIPDCPPTVKCTFSNAGGAIYGRINMPFALAVSSDVYYYTLGVDMYRRKGDVLQDEVRRFGLGSPTGIDLPYEYAGTVPDAKLKAELAARGVISKDEGAGYFVGDNLQLSIGQGLLSATPLQLANGYSTFANGGRLLRPYVVAAVLAPGAPDLAPGQVDLSRATVLRRTPVEVRGEVPVPPEWRQQIIDGLVAVTQNPRGTAYDTFRGYDFARLPIAGKTGTAQDATKRDERDSSLFAAFGPVEAPKYTVAAVLEKAGYGAWAAAPVTRCIFQALSGQTPLPEVVPADPLDKETATEVARIPPPPDTSCLSIGVGGAD